MSDTIHIERLDDWHANSNSCKSKHNEKHWDDSVSLTLASYSFNQVLFEWEMNQSQWN